ncbi:phosphoribosylaminoimidazolesuccinocarboxamide synthase [Alkaliphilus transvaalensis]|nr:phosphoribosylaminoimidazolesuccinocarboxamide synthase [bacterium AH-315-L21]MBN4067589.1 phosphoribosylaminoimidazolesuccinocarboxamide synthase [Alkaliphilus transvaalensis]
MKKLAMLYEGKAKKVYKTEDENKFIVYFKDDATAFNGLKKGTIKEKGIVNNQMSAILFDLLTKKGVKNHFIELLNEREMLVKAVEILPIEVIVRNIAAGSLSKRLGIEEGTVLNTTVLEFSYKNDELGDPLINEDHIRILNLAKEKQVEIIKSYAFQINSILKEYFLERELKLVDFKLEFGVHKGGVILADEISPDTCRLWDVDTDRKMDKDRFRRDLGSVEDAYKEVLLRVMKC